MKTDTSADGVDFVAIRKIFITFVAQDGPNTIRPFNITIIDDDVVENSETINLQASVADPGPGGFTAGGDTAVVIIIDDDGRPRDDIVQ